MSYCRDNGEDSDVYMFPTGRDKIVCCICALMPIEIKVEQGQEYEDQGSMTFDTKQEALQHLQQHRDAGHKVPERAFERLRREIAGVV